MLNTCDLATFSFGLDVCNKDSYNVIVIYCLMVVNIMTVTICDTESGL